MRDNEDRFVVPQGHNPPVQSQTVLEGGDNLSFAVPTEMVELPSKGLLYPLGHPLHGRETLEIKFMTAKEEDILTSKALIKKGVAIDRMLQNLIVDKSVKVEDLLLGDKNALTVAARISGYGQEYAVQVTCPSCEEKSKYEFDLSLVSSTEGQDLTELGVSKTDKGTFVLGLLRTSADVEFRLLTGRDETDMIQQASSKTVKKQEDNSTSQLKRLIVSVNGNTDRRVVSQFVDTMPVIDAKQLRSVVKRVTPDVDMKQDFVCASCGHEEEMEVPFTVEFFWPK